MRVVPPECYADVRKSATTAHLWAGMEREVTLAIPVLSVLSFVVIKGMPGVLFALALAFSLGILARIAASKDPFMVRIALYAWLTYRTRYSALPGRALLVRAQRKSL